MSAIYYFNTITDSKGNHEVHTQECIFLPSEGTRKRIGMESNCQNAIASAKRDNPGKTFDGCFYCSKECHTG